MRMDELEGALDRALEAAERAGGLYDPCKVADGPLNVHRGVPECSLKAHAMLTEFSLHVYRMHTDGCLNANCMPHDSHVDGPAA